MLHSIALALCSCLILYLFWMDRIRDEGVSKATWIPLIWMCIAGSRFVSNWLHLGTPAPIEIFAEGSPLDRTVFLALIVAGVFVIRKRKVPWKELYASNAWVWLFFLFGLISIVWSDLPFVAFKRWVKGLGNVIMVLVILTETEPYRAMESVLRKLAFLLVPLSVLFIKYYPNLGRAYHMGSPMATGVATHKNTLGVVCLVSGIYFCWMFLFRREKQPGLIGKIRISLHGVIVLMIAWLLYKADSATSLSCMLLALVILSISRFPSLRLDLQRTMSSILVFFGLLAASELLFGLKDKLISLLGRDPSLTTRVPMWKDLISMVRNPLLGFGYESFWMGDRTRIIAETWNVRWNAHNGYLQVYLDLGLIGIFFVMTWIFSGLKKIWRSVQSDYAIGLLRFIFILVAVFYSYTEAAFSGVSLIWIILFFGIMDPPAKPSTHSP